MRNRLVSLLLTAGLQLPALAGTSPLIRAMQAGSSAQALQAVEQGANPDTRTPDGTPVLVWAVSVWNADLVTALLRHHAQPGLADAAGRTPLMQAAANYGLGEPQRRILRELLAAGAPLDARNRQGQSALMQAAEWDGSGQAVALLLAGKADPQLQDHAGRDALMYAADAGNAQALRELLAAGARVSARDRAGWTALMYAARWGQPSGLNALLAKGAPLDATNQQGWTALMIAVYAKQPATVRRLLAAGAQLHPQNLQGQTALAIARTRGVEEITRALLAAGAR